MKINKFFLSLAGAAMMMLASCGNEDLELGNSTTTPLDPSVASVEFSASNKTTFEVDPADPTFTVTMTRKATDAATYKIVVENNEENAFIVPATVAFAEGETKANVQIQMAPDAKQGEPLSLTLAIDESDANPYTTGLKSYTLNTTIIKWESIGKGYWLGNLINTFFGVTPLIPMYVEIEAAETATAKKFRFTSPYAFVATAEDDNGAYNGYPYNQSGNLDGNVEKFVITVTKDGASLAPVNLGMDYGYGSFSIGQIYGNLSSNIQSYPLGVYTETETGGNITFPASSLYISMAKYNDGGKYPASAGPSYLYLSEADYLAATEE